MFTSVLDTPLGTLVIRADDDRVTSILFREPDDVENANAHTAAAREQLEEYFAGSRLQFTFPFGQDGTAFSQSVWAALLHIGAGKPISYQALSRRLNNPLAIRAIAAANGRNNLTIIVPCHRVIGSKGDLVGYSGELWRKKWLLEHEAKMTGTGQATIF